MVVLILVGLFLLPASLAAGYYAGLVGVGRWPQANPARPAVWPRLAVLVPAHDEEGTLPITLKSVFAADYSADRLDVLVVADNCTDRTPHVAAEWGAKVLVRTDRVNRGKGFALELGFAQLLSQPVDGVIVLDADCELPRNGLKEFAAELAAGAAVVQAARMPRNGRTGPTAAVSEVGSWIENAVSAGRSRLGWTVPLRGSGMLFSRATLEQVPWRAYGLVEDAEYGQQLAEQGVPSRFRADLVIRGEVPTDVAVLTRQRARWRTTLFARGPGFITRWLASKPLVLLHLALTGLAAGFAAWQHPNLALSFSVWYAALITLTATVYLPPLRQVGGWNAVRAAGVGVRLISVTLAGLVRTPKTWERTPRATPAS